MALRHTHGRLWRSLWLFALCLFEPGADAHPLGAPPGRLVDIGGYRLHLYCEGGGAPTVILDAGLGGTSLEWLPVVAEVREFTQVCVYDRAGYGWSDMGPAPRTSSANGNELYLLLLAADLPGPFVLVGHSYGGYNVQLFARRYPYLTAGLVLVDASHPAQVERFQAPPYDIKTAPVSRYGTVQFGEAPKLNPLLSPEARLLALYQYKHYKPRRAIAYELLGFRDSARELRDGPPLEPMPLAVLTRGKRVWPAGVHGDQLERLWLDLQAELAAQSPTSAHLIARASGHQIHLEQPDLTTYAIALVADAVRAARPDGANVPRARAQEHLHLAVRNAVWLRDTLDVATPAKVVAQSGIGAYPH